MKEKRTALDIYNRLSTSYSKDQGRLQLWYLLLACHVYSTRSVSRALKTACGLSLPGYDVLSVIAQYPDGVNMTQLAKLLLVRNSNITGIVSRLEESGYIVRLVTSDDKRGRLVKFTRKGVQYWKQSNRSYEEIVERLLQDIKASDRIQIGRQLGLMQSRLNPDV